ncbi:hypothetical protein [Comamonas sp. SCN 65-56]|uniref:hypothetical protein n=1 Tax=Comamonas sp. SCN 65-56 TaxID=1660095 RepID=UPI0025C6D00E|nr:hypothetical protein [Comamonas sp. SCN 65-56]
MKPALLRTIFWVFFSAFIVWDYTASPPVDLRRELAPMAAGSGQATKGGHCSMPE